jgi:hypothetical protein
MAGVVLRVRFTSGDHTDVRYEDAELTDEDEIIEKIVSTLAADPGLLRCHRGDRLLVLFARGVASVEIAPRGAIL